MLRDSQLHISCSESREEEFQTEVELLGLEDGDICWRGTGAVSTEAEQRPAAAVVRAGEVRGPMLRSEHSGAASLKL